MQLTSWVLVVLYRTIAAGTGRPAAPSPLRLSSLPDEILERVCSDLNAASLKALSLTCRALHLESQRRLFSSITFDLTPSTGAANEDKGVEMDETLPDWVKELDSKSRMLLFRTDTLLSLPFGIRSLTLVAHESHDELFSISDDIPKGQHAALAYYLEKMSEKCNIDSIEISCSSVIYGYVFIHHLRRVQLQPRRFALNGCSLLFVSSNVLSSLLETWSKCTSLTIGPFMDEPEDFNIPEESKKRAAVLCIDFFQQEHPQLKTLKVRFSPWQQSILTSAFFKGISVLQVGTSSSWQVLGLLQQIPREEIAIQEVEIWYEAYEDEEENEDLYVDDDGWRRPSSSALEILATCPRVRRARVALSRYDMAKLERSAPCTTIEHLHIEHYSTRLPLASLKLFVEWFGDRTASPGLQSVQLHHDWQEHEESVREFENYYDDEEGEEEDGLLDEDYLWPLIDEDPSLLSVRRYRWDSESPLEDEDEDDVLARMREEILEERFSAYRKLIARARRTLDERGIRYILEMPFEDHRSIDPEQQTLYVLVCFPARPIR